MQVNGLKGPSWLCCLRYFDVVRSICPEYKHLALLGVSKLILSLWMNEMEIQSHIIEIEKRIKTS